jgi:hypothetical protein
MDAVLQLSQMQRVQLFEQTAQLTGMEAVIVEKDFWVCWTLIHRKSSGSAGGLPKFDNSGSHRGVSLS